MSKEPHDDPKYDALDTLERWHHGLVDAATARMPLATLLEDDQRIDTLVENATVTVQQLGDTAAILHPVTTEGPEDPFTNGFTCTNPECPQPKGVWSKDGELGNIGLWNVIPWTAVKHCPVCGGTDIVFAHYYAKGEEVECVDGNILVQLLLNELALESDGAFIGRGYQHRANMRSLYRHFGFEPPESVKM